MENLDLSLFESQSNPLTNSTRKVLQELPTNQNQIQAFYKSLLNYHISNISDQTERQTWRSFLTTIENLSNTTNKIYIQDYKKPEHEEFEFSKFLKEESFRKKKEQAVEHYEWSLIRKAVYGFSLFFSLVQSRKKALFCLMNIKMKLRYVESFMVWQIGCESPFYKLSLKLKSIRAWKRNHRKYKNYEEAWKYYEGKEALKVMIEWTGLLREKYEDCKKKYRPECVELEHDRVGRYEYIKAVRHRDGVLERKGLYGWKK